MCKNHWPSLIGTRTPRISCLSAIALAAMLAAAGKAAGQPGGPPSRAVLHRPDGGQSAGEIRPSTKSGVLSWKSASAESPVDLVWNEVSSIEWPAATPQPNRTGDFTFELAGGDLLFGSLLALDDKQAELEIPQLGASTFNDPNSSASTGRPVGESWFISVRTASSGGNRLSTRTAGATTSAAQRQTTKLPRSAVTLAYPISPASSSGFPGGPIPISYSRWASMTRKARSNTPSGSRRGEVT